MRILFNVTMLYLLMRMWPVGGRAGLDMAGSSRSPEAVSINVPFSEFIRRAKANEVQSVMMDGMHVSFTPRPSTELMSLSKSLEGQVRGGGRGGGLRSV